MPLNFHFYVAHPRGCCHPISHEEVLRRRCTCGPARRRLSRGQQIQRKLPQRQGPSTKYPTIVKAFALMPDDTVVLSSSSRTAALLLRRCSFLRVPTAIKGALLRVETVFVK